VRSGNEFKSLSAGPRHGPPIGFSRPSALSASILLATFISLAACNKDPKAHAWPAGTVIAVDEVPVTSAEVAQDMLAIVLMQPEWADPQLKRLAFNEISLPRALLRGKAGAEARDAARRAIDEKFARIQSGTQVGPQPSPGVYGHEVSGSWKDLGLTSWGMAMNLSVGEWSEVLEEPGAFVRVRLIERQDGPVPLAARLRVDRIDAVYAESKSVGYLDSELKQHRLTIVDPAWDTIVPERMKFLMGVHGR
jgi:hypothetical protein